MQGLIYRELQPVRRRQQGLLVTRAAVAGLLVSSLAGVGLGIWRWVTGAIVTPAMIVALLAAGPLLGALVGVVRQLGWQTPAHAVDRHYALKDRSATALDFLARSERSPLHELQVRDAEEHLAAVAAGEVVPPRLPRLLPFACASLAVAIAILALPLSSKRVSAGPTPPLPAVVAEAESVAEDLKQLDELAKQERNPELEKLLEQLKHKVEEMKQPGVDAREALAKLSEMQQTIAAYQAQYNVGLVDAQLGSLGEALTPAESLEAAGKALMDAKFDKAAEKLEQLEEPPLDRKEAKAVEEKLKQVAQAMGDVGLGQMGAAATEMAEGIKGGHKGKFLKATKELARLVRGHKGKRKLKEILDAELEALEEGKNRANDPNVTYRIRMPQKSKTPSQDWGAEISGSVYGNKTNLKTNRETKEITGNPGDGPSEMETTHSPEGRQTSARGYREAYQKYRKMSEAVLNSEPIPLSHRQTIRKYFELIRPQNLDGDEAGEGKK